MLTGSKVFIDTNVFVALRDSRDSTHEGAKKLLESLMGMGAEFFTSSDVIAETATVISRKLGKEQVKIFLKGVGNMAKEIFIDEVLHKKTRKFFQMVGLKNISFVDCSCVVAMKREGIDLVFSFDEQFRKMGVKLVSDRG